MRQIWRAYLGTFRDIFLNGSIFTTLVLSVLFYSFFYPTAYRAQQTEALPIIVVDEEQSALTAAIIQQVSGNPNVEIQAVMGDFAAAKSALQQQHADGVLLLPSNLSQTIRHGESGGIGLYLSATNFLVTKQIGLGLASSIESTLSNYAARFGEISHFSPANSVHQIALFNPLSGYGSYVFPAVAPLIIHQTILLGLAMLLVLYREQQRVWSWQQFTGLSFSILSISGLGCLYLFGFTFWLFDYPRGGNFLGMLLSIPVFIFCMIGMTTLLASFLDVAERAGHVIVFSSIPLFMLSGVAWPHSAMPTWMQYLGEFLPSTHIVQLFIQLNQMGVATQLVLSKLVYLLIFGSVCLVWGYQRLKRQSLAKPA